jgi:hypothetical protein
MQSHIQCVYVRSTHAKFAEYAAEQRFFYARRPVRRRRRSTHPGPGGAAPDAWPTASSRPRFGAVPKWQADAAGLQPAAALASANWPADPSGDFGWNAGLAGTADIQSAFNQARTNENSQLGTSLPALTLPAQAPWNGMSDGARAAWLINRERIDRGVLPMQGEEPHVTGVAQSFAQYLFDHDAFVTRPTGATPGSGSTRSPPLAPATMT